MKIEQIYTGCLAEAAYYVESAGEVAIIDPLREVSPYLERAQKDGAKIKYILETHFHADFVSGHLDLAKRSGGTIVFGPTAEPAFKAHVAKDGEEMKLGEVTLIVLHTPGHTMESTTYLLRDEKGKDHCIFTGDTLFIGDVGRPDLAVKTDLSREDLAGHLFDSLRDKIMPLADDVIVYPGHGAGSACGKNMSKETSDTLGNQKKFNYALRSDMPKSGFVKEVTDGLVEPPQYFPKNAVMNKTGYESIDAILQRGATALTPEKFEEKVKNHRALVLDARSPGEYAQGHIPGAIFIGLDGSFASWAGTLITDLNQPLVIVAPRGREEEAVTRLSRVGYDNTLGYLQGGLQAWQEAGKGIATIRQIEAGKMAQKIKQGDPVKLLDVRKASEYESQHIHGVTNFPLDFINKNIGQLDRDTPYFLHCLSGYRSMVAASILQSKGFASVTDVKGGFNELSKTGLPLTQYMPPVTML